MTAADRWHFRTEQRSSQKPLPSCSARYAARPAALQRGGHEFVKKKPGNFEHLGRSRNAATDRRVEPVLRRFAPGLFEGSMMAPEVRKGMPPVKLSREEFERRYRSRFTDPAFEPLQRELDSIIAAAWDGYSSSRKAP